jgi:hypothetical protein
MSVILALIEVLGYTGAMQTVSEALRSALESCGQTRYGVSKATGIPESTLSRFLVAGKPMHGENIDRLASYLGLVLTAKAGKARKGN